MAFTTIVHGAREVEAAFTKVAMKVDRETGRALSLLGEPVRRDAESLALANITNIGPRWSKFRRGRKKVGVYVAARQHGSHGLGTRANFFPLVMSEALEPALARHRAEIYAGVRRIIDELCHEAEQGMYRV